MKKLLISLSLLLSSCSPAFATTSTINPMVPVNGQQVQAPPVQQNFQHAYNDINNLWSQFPVNLTNNVTGFLNLNSSNITGILQYQNGGTGLSVLGANGTCIGSTGSAISWISCGGGGGGGTPGGTSGQIQTNNGTGSFGAFTASGDFTINTSTGVATLTTVNSNTGSFGSPTSIPSFTINGKGLITAASGNAVIAPAGTLSGSSLSSGVTSSSLTSFGTNPALGAATATSINKVAITAPASSATLTIANGKTLTDNNTLTLSATDGSSVAFGTGGTVLYGNQTITLSGDTGGSGTTAITTTTSKVNGVSYGTSPSTNTVPVVTGANAVTYEAIPNAALVNSSFTLNPGASSCSLGGSCTLQDASSSALGVVQGDGSTISISNSGVASCTTATATQKGCIIPDNSTITISGGVISAVGSVGTVTLGTSSTAANPQRTSQAGTGLFSAATNTVSVAAGGVVSAIFNTIASGVDNLSVIPSATGGANPGSITIGAAGSDSNVNIALAPKGGGAVTINSGSSVVPEPFGQVWLYIQATTNTEPLVICDSSQAACMGAFVNPSDPEAIVQWGSVSGRLGFFTNEATTQLTLDTNGGAAIGLGATYDEATPPANGLIVQGLTGIGTASPVSGSAITINGLISSQGGSTTCGTGCTSITANSNNTRGSATSSSAVTSIIINWSTTLGAAPFCILGSNQDTSLWDYTASTTSLTITTASAVTSKIFTWHCMQ